MIRNEILISTMMLLKEGIAGYFLCSFLSFTFQFVKAVFLIQEKDDIIHYKRYVEPKWYLD